MLRGNESLYFPGFGCLHYHVTQVGEAFAGLDFVHLVFNLRLVGGCLHVTDHSDGEGKVMAVHHGQLLLEEVDGVVGVMHEHIVNGVAILADSDGLETEAILHETLGVVLAEEHLLAVAQMDGVVLAELLVGHVGMDTVVEDDAVLHYLHHTGTLVAGRSLKHFEIGVERDIETAGEEVAPRAEAELGGDEGVFGRAVGA